MDACWHRAAMGDKGGGHEKAGGGKESSICGSGKGVLWKWEKSCKFLLKKKKKK